ncbi:AraC family transcriptional regulator [Pedobacter sp. L105]|uniref:AraC family transcriptional regulator n=1 Tax=Pedobacter sp. L105 TaxID=1641871 RepID=UPI00131B87CC|nr:AraC family transcriptional regulator [Pedobacter sp. L105]
MINYYKYLPLSTEDKKWGLYVLDAGCTRTEPSGIYPISNHPSQYYFNWNNGRILDEYQLIYITKGSGFFESDHCHYQEIKAGTIIILFPGERHRYKPAEQTGWDEYWIGLKGEILDNLVNNSFFSRENPCLYIGFNEQIFEIYEGIIEKTKTEVTGYQPLISGAAFYLMGSLHAILKQSNVEHEDREILVDKARILFRSNIDKTFSPEQAAEELQVGYSLFRKVFKNYTGLSPGQYFIQLKIEKAKTMLADSTLSVKEIAYTLTFDSSFYFSKVFKEKTGMTPTAYRQRAMGMQLSP